MDRTGDNFADTYPSINLAADEAYNRHVHEQERRSGINSRTSIIIAINAIVTSFLQSQFFMNSPLKLVAILTSFSAILAGVIVLLRRDYSSPDIAMDDFWEYAKYDVDDFYDSVLVEYSTVARNNSQTNDSKEWWFGKSFSLTIMSLLYVFIWSCYNIITGFNI